ncbi:MAG: TetR/AcrR family transcriptional regulator [Pseudomonadales bacterium]
MAKSSQAAVELKNDWRADRNNELSELLRGKILDAARACLKKNDYAKLRMDMIAREAGCSRGTLYRYFASKEEILLNIAIGNYQHIAIQVAEAISKIKDPRLRFATGLTRAMALAVKEDNLSTLNMDMINRAMVTDPKTLNQTVAVSLAPYFEAAEAEGLLRAGTDLQETSEWIIQSSNGLLNTGWPNVGGKLLNEKQQVDYLCRYLLYPVFDMRDIV